MAQACEVALSNRLGSPIIAAPRGINLRDASMPRIHPERSGP